MTGTTVHIGNPRYIGEIATNRTVDGLDDALDTGRELESDGKMAVLVVVETSGDLALLGWLGYIDTIRADAAATIVKLRETGVEQIVMLTGDNERVARHIAGELGIDEVYAEPLPEQKVDHVEALQQRYEAVAMVGDGVNDAPGLATADVTVWMGVAGTAWRSRRPTSS